MSIKASATLDANKENASGAEISLTDETIITLYVVHKAGAHSLHRVTIEYTPDGVNWFRSPRSINGHDLFMTEQVL